MQPLPPRRWKAPQAKFRGKRKYFRQVLRDAEVFRVDVDPPWWNLWHYHADWPGWGNLGWRYRLEHLRALAIVFRRVLEASPSIPVPFQTWITLDVDDAKYDGVFIHSPNPHSSDFPFKPDTDARDGAGNLSAEGASATTASCTWGVGTLDATLSALLPGLRLRVGRCSWPGEDDHGVPCLRTTYFVYSPDAGVPLE